MSTDFAIRINGRPVEGVVCSTSWARLRGLLGRKSTYAGFMVFPGVRQVHTWFMGFSIFVAAIADNGQVLEVREVPPFRRFTGPESTVAMVECSSLYHLRTLLSPGAQVSWSE